MNTLIILAIAALVLFLLFNSSNKEHFDNTTKLAWTDLAASQCSQLTEESNKIDKLMDSCNVPDKGEGQRAKINDKRNCVDNVNRQINNDRDRNLWCAAKDSKPFVSSSSMDVAGKGVPADSHEIPSVYDFKPFPKNVVQSDFSSLNNERSEVPHTAIVTVPVSSETMPTNEQLTVNPEVTPNFEVNVNTEVNAIGMLDKYSLLKPPFLEGVDASVKHSFASL